VLEMGGWGGLSGEAKAEVGVVISGG